MKRFYIFFLLILTGALPIFSQTIVGKVIDETGREVSFASVYFQENPSIGTVTDQSGVFKFSEEQLQRIKSDVLVVSFIGLKTELIPVGPDLLADTIKVQMKEQPILLAEAVVGVKKKKSKRRQKKELLAAIKEQMRIDFPNNSRSYQVSSGFRMNNEQGRPLLFEEMIGTIVELPLMKDKGKEDSIQIKADYKRRYFNQRLQDGLKNLAENGGKKKQQEKWKEVQKQQKAGMSLIAHKMLWGSRPIWLIDKFDSKLSKWTIEDLDDNKFLLRYNERQNYLGILVIDLELQFIVGRYSYSVSNISQDIKIKANIPFGYKLKKEQLDVLNSISMGEVDIKKFRLKRVNAKMKRNILFKREGAELVVSEKSLIADVVMSDRKSKQVVSINNTATTRTLGVRLAGVKPFTQKELDAPVENEMIEISDLK